MDDIYILCSICLDKFKEDEFIKCKKCQKNFCDNCFEKDNEDIECLNCAFKSVPYTHYHYINKEEIVREMCCEIECVFHDYFPGIKFIDDSEENRLKMRKMRRQYINEKNDLIQKIINNIII